MQVQRTTRWSRGKATRRRGLLALLLLLGQSLAGLALADEYDRAKRMHDRLVGVPPDAGELEAMAVFIRDENYVGAAERAMMNPVFYNSTLKTFITPRTNQEQTVFAPLNDYTATVIGIIRDRLSFKQVLTGNTIYIGANQNPNYSVANNDHYEALEDSGADLSDDTVLVPRNQSQLNGMSNAEAAGVLTTRASGKAFFSAGTNRRMVRYIAINYLCRDLEALQDTTLPIDWIRQDVPRSPGGDSTIFLNSCSGCHTGMDPFAGAFAYFDWDGDDDDPDAGRVRYTPGVVSAKHLINANTFPFGYATVDDRWENRWITGPNSVLGWRSAQSSGYGPKSMGQQIADSEAFSRCQVEQVFEQVCFRPPSNETDREQVETIRGDFEDGGYDLIDVFADTAVYCTEGM